MTENLYRVVLTGELAAGKSENAVKTRMAVLFKTTADNIGAFLKKPGTVIKKDIDLATAKKYAGAILSTGALCKIDPPEPSAVKPPAPAEAVVSFASVVASEDLNGRAEPRVVVIQLSKKPEDRFTPKVLETVSGATNGITLNTSVVAFDKIHALAAFNEGGGGSEVTKLYLFLRGYERPLVCDIDSIRFSEFPIKVFPKNIASFRGFLHFLCKNNPSIILEETTLDFLSGSTPQQLDAVKAMKLATGMGLLIESGDIESQT